MQHVMSGFHFVLADFSDLNTVVQHTLNNPVHARFIRFYPVTFAYFPCMRVEVFAQWIQNHLEWFFFSRKNDRFQELWNTFFFHLPWFTVTCHLRLLYLFKCLNTALKTSSKSQNHTDMTLLTCWVAELRDKLWKRSQGRITEDNPLGGLL